MMTLFFYAYLFLQPLEIYLERIPKGPPGINYANLTMVALVAWWLTGRPRRGLPPVLATPLNVPVVAMLLWTWFGMVLTTVSIPGAPSAFDPLSDSFKQFLQFYNGFLIFFVAANMIDSRRKMLGALIALCLTSIPVARAFRSDLAAVSTWHYSNNMRVCGPFVYIGSNELATFFVYGSLFLGLFGLTVGRPILKSFFFGAGSLYAYGVLYSFSRGAQLAFVAAGALVALLRYRAALLILLLLAVTSSAWLPVSVRERWEMTKDEEGQLDASAQSRKDFARLAWDLFKESPVLGNGVGSFKALNPRAMDTHNHYLRTLTESGVIGFGVLMGLWGTILFVSFKLWRGGGQPFDRHYGFCLMIATAGLMITNLFGDRFTHFSMIGQYWALVGMGARLYAGMTGAEPLAEDATEGKKAAGEHAAVETGATGAGAAMPEIRPKTKKGVRTLAGTQPALRRVAEGKRLRLLVPAAQVLVKGARGPVRTPVRGGKGPMVLGRPGGKELNIVRSKGCGYRGRDLGRPGENAVIGDTGGDEQRIGELEEILLRGFDQGCKIDHARIERDRGHGKA